MFARQTSSLELELQELTTTWPGLLLRGSGSFLLPPGRIQCYIPAPRVRFIVLAVPSHTGRARISIWECADGIANPAPDRRGSLRAARCRRWGYGDYLGAAHSTGVVPLRAPTRASYCCWRCGAGRDGGTHRSPG